MSEERPRRLIVWRVHNLSTQFYREYTTTTAHRHVDQRLPCFVRCDGYRRFSRAHGRMREAGLEGI